MSEPHSTTIEIAGTQFERRKEFLPPFDKRDPDPSKNYGIGSGTYRFLLIGPLGATQFVYYNGPSRARGVDVGMHSKKPGYKGHSPMKCDIFGECFYDGSGLMAEAWLRTYLALGENTPRGEEWVWDQLLIRYRDWIEGELT